MDLSVRFLKLAEVGRTHHYKSVDDKALFLARLGL
jgi:hypothetical protein